MKGIGYTGFLLVLAMTAAAQDQALSLEKVTVPQAIQVIYQHILKRAFVLSPEVAQDPRLITLQLTENSDIARFMEDYLRTLNISITRRQGVDYLQASVPVIKAKAQEFFVYQPRYRSAAYLTTVLQDTVSKNSASSQQSLVTAATGDSVTFQGTREDIVQIKRILSLIDTRNEEVMVTGYIFEVHADERNGSGFMLAAKLLADKLHISLGQVQQGFTDMIRFNTGSLTVLYELFRTDSRFQVISAPRLRVKNGARATFSVGSEVPVLGQVDYQGNRAVQSINYRTSGVILTIQPHIRSKVIDLTLQQQLSNFIRTTTGVNSTPTLIKREIQTEVSVISGEIILLGGLAETKASKTDTGFSLLPRLFDSQNREKSRTDILVILQVEKVIH